MKKEWRCTNCNKRLGDRWGLRVHIRSTRGHEYFASAPITAICKGCGHRNTVHGE